jgi:hypothetical protein
VEVEGLKEGMCDFFSFSEVLADMFDLYSCIDLMIYQSLAPAAIAECFFPFGWLSSSASFFMYTSQKVHQATLFGGIWLRGFGIRTFFGLTSPDYLDRRLPVVFGHINAVKADKTTATEIYMAKPIS